MKYFNESFWTAIGACILVVIAVISLIFFIAKSHPCPNDGSTKRFYDSRCNPELRK